MRRSSFSPALTLALALLSGALSATPAAGALPPASVAASANLPEDVRIPGSGGVRLDGLLYRPAGPGPHPLVVLPASWGLPKLEYTVIATRLAARGYVAVAYSPRGFYGSSGTIEVAGPEDQADLSAVIDWAIATQGADPELIGAFGISYGAGISLLGASRDARIDAVVALSGWTDLEASLVPGGALNSGASELLGTVGRVTGRPGVALETALAAARTGDVESVLPLADERSVGRRLAGLNAHGTAVMICNGWQDSIFPPDQVLATWDGITGPKKLLLAPGDHAITELGGLVGLVNDYVDAGAAWLDRFLLGTPNGVEDGGTVQARPTLGGAWEHFDSAAAFAAGPRRAYLGRPSGPLSIGASLTDDAPRDWSADYRGGWESGAALGPVLLSGTGYAAGLPPTAWMPGLNRAHGLVWQTVPQRSGITLSGTPRLRATVTPSRAEATLVAYLYDVDPLGKGTLVTVQPWTRKRLAAGQPVEVDLPLQPVLHTVRRGHRLALVVDSTESRFYSETAWGERITLGGRSGAPAYLELPIR